MVVRKQWKQALSDNQLWWRLCRDDYGVGGVFKLRNRLITSHTDAYKPDTDYR